LNSWNYAGVLRIKAFKHARHVSPMKIFNKSVAKGSKTSFRVELASYPDGSPIGVWVRALNGINDGPTLTLLGAQNGDEYSGI
jgi:hypothetical protein